MRKGIIVLSILIAWVFLFTGIPSTPVTNISLCSAQVQPSEDELFTLGTRAFNDGLYDLTKITLTKLIELYPQSSKVQEARYLIAKSNMAMGNRDKAIEEFSKIDSKILSGDKKTEAELWHAESLFKKGKYTEASKIYSSIYNENPQSSLADQALYGVAFSEMESKNYEKAIQGFKKLIDEFPKSDFIQSAEYNSGRCYIFLAKYGEAVEALSKYLSNYSQGKFSAEAQYLLAWSYLKMKNYKQAIVEFSKFLSNYTKHEYRSEVLLTLGNLLFEGKEYTEALRRYQEFQKEFAGNPSIPESIYWEAVAYQKLGKIEESNSVFNRFINKYPKDKLIYQVNLELGNNYNRLKKYPQSLELYNKAAQSTDKSVAAEARFHMGEMHYRLERFSKAASEFEKLIKNYPDEKLWVYPALFNLGLTYERLKDYTKAANAYRRVIKESKDKDLIKSADERLKRLNKSKGRK